MDLLMKGGVMMRLLVFSDSHGSTRGMLEAFRRQTPPPDAVAFLGDGLRDVAYCDFGDVPIYAVEGNCDVSALFYPVNATEELVITLGGKRFFMAHGHMFGVKHDLFRIVAAAAAREADVVLFGHTHMPFEKYYPAGENELGVFLKKPLYLFNPGSVGGYGGSFGTVTVDKSGAVLLSHGSL